MQRIFQFAGLHRLFTCKHLISISTNCIDFTVMYDETVRMCTFPAWIGVSTETGVNHSNSGFIIRILQITKEGSQLSHQEHTFIDDGTAGHGYYIRIVITLFKHPAGNI